MLYDLQHSKQNLDWTLPQVLLHLMEVKQVFVWEQKLGQYPVVSQQAVKIILRISTCLLHRLHPHGHKQQRKRKAWVENLM